MASTFEYRFDELPLFADPGGVECYATASGIADIEADSDGEWAVDAISLDGRHPKDSYRDKRRLVPIPRTHPLYALIKAAIERDPDPVNEIVDGARWRRSQAEVV